MIKQYLTSLHFLTILAAMSVGFYLSFTAVIVLVALHRLHIIILGDCVLTKIERHFGIIPKDVDFLQYALKKITKRNIQRSTGIALDYLFALTPVMIAGTRTLLML